MQENELNVSRKLVVGNVARPDSWLRKQLAPFGKPPITMFLASMAVLLLIWSLLTLFVPPLFLPSPLTTFATLVQLIESGFLLESLIISLSRMLQGWSIGVGLAIVVGWLMGWVPVIRYAFQPIFDFLRFIPPLGLLGLAIFWFGTGEASKIILLAYASFLGSVIYVYTSVSTIKKDRILAAKSLGAGRWQIFRTVMVPSTIPDILVGARVAIGYCFLTITTTEMMDANSGLGFLIQNGRLYLKMDQVFVGILFLGLFGLCMDYFLNRMTKKLGYRYFIDRI